MTDKSAPFTLGGPGLKQEGALCFAGQFSGPIVSLELSEPARGSWVKPSLV